MYLILICVVKVSYFQRLHCIHWHVSLTTRCHFHFLTQNFLHQNCPMNCYCCRCYCHCLWMITIIMIMMTISTCSKNFVFKQVKLYMWGLTFKVDSWHQVRTVNHTGPGKASEGFYITQCTFFCFKLLFLYITRYTQNFIQSRHI